MLTLNLPSSKLRETFRPPDEEGGDNGGVEAVMLRVDGTKMGALQGLMHLSNMESWRGRG